MTSLKTKLKRIFNCRKLREVYNEWAILLPAKSHLDSEYNFPRGRAPGQAQEARRRPGAMGWAAGGMG